MYIAKFVYYLFLLAVFTFIGILLISRITNSILILFLTPKARKHIRMLARLVYAYKIREKKLSGVIDIRLSMNNESILHNIRFNLEGLLNEFKIRPSNLEKTIKKDMDPDYSNYRF